jgi:membrane protein DedA with SNARE-associated domain
MTGLFDAVSSTGWLVYILTFTFMFLETSGLPLPALSFALLAATLAGSGQLSFVAVLLATILGATLGAPVGHALGRRRGRPLLEQIGGRVHLSQERIDSTEEQFTRRGKTIVVGRFFVPVLPWSAGIFAGIVRMPRRTLVLYTFFGITLWAVIELTIVAYFSSLLVDFVSKFTGAGLFWIATGVVGTYVLIRVFRRRREARRAGMAILAGADAMAEPDAGEAGSEPPAEAATLDTSTTTAAEDVSTEVTSAGPVEDANGADSGAAPESIEQEANKH